MSFREIARCPNARGFKKPNDNAFTAQNVANSVDRTTARPAGLSKRLTPPTTLKAG